MKQHSTSSQNSSRSPFKTIKHAFKLHKLNNNPTTLSSISTSDRLLQIDNVKLTVPRSPTKSKSTKKIMNRNNRKSAQRISLFKYDNVKVLTGFLTTTTSSVTSQDFRIPSTSLLAMGPLEIYEIKTNSSCSKYITIGKNSNVIHPLLSTLRVTKLLNKVDQLTIQYYISFSNPDRFWEIQFLDADDHISENFEDVISKLCQLIFLDDGDHHEDSRTINDESADDLNYLLDESSDNEEEVISNKSVLKPPIFLPKRRSTINTYVKGIGDSNDINLAFKNALKKARPTLNTYNDSMKWSLSEDFNSIHSNKKKVKYRESMYIHSSSDDFGQVRANRRSFSVFSDYETLVSLQNLKLQE